MKLFLIITGVLFFYPPTVKAQLFIQNGAVLKTTGNAVITLQDIDLVNNGTINQLPGEGKFVFTGSADNFISGTSSPLFDIMEIAKTSAAKISLSQHITIGSGINFTSGLINLNSNNIFLQPAALLNGENENSRIVGTGGGYVEITGVLNAPSTVNPGNLGAVISTVQNLGSTIIRRGHTSQVNGTGSGSSILRYYDILPTNNTALNATLRINYLDAELNNHSESSLTLWKSINTTTWTNMGFGLRDATTNYVQQSGLADFSRWTLSSLTSPLPVYFSLFNIGCSNGVVSITWKTAQEQNSGHFEIEKSDDGIHFKTISNIPAAGNSSTEKSYSYIDNNTSPGNVFYRVAEINTAGGKQYTAINRIQCGVLTDEIKIWPNPVQQLLFVNINAATASSINIKVYDAKGALVIARQQNVLPGSNQLNLDVSKLPQGMYSLLPEWNNGQHYKAIPFCKN